MFSKQRPIYVRTKQWLTWGFALHRNQWIETLGSTLSKPNRAATEDCHETNYLLFF